MKEGAGRERERERTNLRMLGPEIGLEIKRPGRKMLTEIAVMNWSKQFVAAVHRIHRLEPGVVGRPGFSYWPQIKWCKSQEGLYGSLNKGLNLTGLELGLKTLARGNRLFNTLGGVHLDFDSARGSSY